MQGVCVCWGQLITTHDQEEFTGGGTKTLEVAELEVSRPQPAPNGMLEALPAWGHGMGRRAHPLLPAGISWS